MNHLAVAAKYHKILSKGTFKVGRYKRCFSWIASPTQDDIPSLRFGLAGPLREIFGGNSSNAREADSSVPDLWNRDVGKSFRSRRRCSVFAVK